MLKQGNKKITLEELKVHVLKNQHKRVIVEFIKKKTAQEFYRLIKNDTDEGVTVRLMTGNSNIQERKDIINEIKELESVILVATQVIEAGVDIDMDIGYKDISRLDSEEQFMGRINRSCKKENCIVYFFNYDDAGKMLYDIKNQEVFAGGSGCGCISLVTMGYVVDCLKKGIYNKVLLIATGALMNPIMVAQNETIPAIAHAVVLERSNI